MSDWGQGAKNNNIGWGQGAVNNDISWGKSHELSYSGDTEIFGARPLLLDLYPNAAAAYSLRKIRTDYTGDAIRVRRASDNTELDIGFVNNELDVASLETFCSGTNGFVTTIYEQSGATTDFIQTNALRQGRIVIGGVVNLENGKPIILRSVDDNGGYLNSSLDFIADTNIYGFHYVGRSGILSLFRSAGIFGSSSGGGDYGYALQQNSTSILVNNDSVPSNEILNGEDWTYTNRGDVYNDLVNQFLLTAGMQFNFTNSGYALGYRFTNPSNVVMTSFQENIIFQNNDNQIAIQEEQNNFYNIYP